MIVASLASLSSRLDLLQRTVESLLPQVDALCVYLNGHTTIPSFLHHPKVLHAILSREAGWRGAEAKLWFFDDDEFKAAPRWNADDVALICDDDIVYPPDYAQSMVAALDRHPGSLVCVHGSVIQEPFVDYATSRMVARSRGPLAVDSRVHIPGTGTTAFRCSTLRVSLRNDFWWSHCVDPHVALACRRQGVPVWSVQRPDGWLAPQRVPASSSSIFRQRVGAGNTSHEDHLLRVDGGWEPLDASTLGFAPRKVAAKVVPKTPALNPGSMLPAEAFEWLEQRLSATTGAIVELGSGHGTERLLAMARGRRLISVEHDSRFIDLVRGTEYLFAPIRRNWYDHQMMRKKLPQADQIGALIVDGPPRKIGRKGILLHLDMFPPKIPMLIDDVQRPDEHKLALRIGVIRDQPVTFHTCHDGRAFATIGWPEAPGRDYDTVA